MKKLYIISLLSILSLPAFGASATNPFDGVTTVDAAWEKFESESQKILDSYKKQLNNKEFKKLKELRTEILDKKPDATKDDKTTDNNATVAERKLTPEEQEKKIAELRDNADAMKEKEQSTANKMLGGATMAATGIGGMQLASALAEQSADNEAEQDMRAYLATFSCKYGNERASGGERDIELPGGNELINLYSEYVALANDLKVRKNALGVKPGIESEAILDSAKTGLYDDEGLEPRTGAYASLARALQNPDGEDAKMWAAQREKTAENLKTGATVAGIGAVGGLVANLAINAKAPKERSAAINAKYASLKKELQNVQDEIDKVEDESLKTENCEKYNATGEFNNCTCSDTNSYWDSNQKKCVNCENGQTVNTEKNGCETAVEEEQECTLTGVINKSECTCAANATQTENKCSCNTNYTEHRQEDGTTICELTQELVSTELTTISLSADTLFESGKSTISDENKTALIENIWTTLEEANQDNTNDIFQDLCLVITGHADHIGNASTNQTLSEERAKAVANILVEKSEGKLTASNYIIVGKGESECNEETNRSNDAKKRCRRVDIKLNTGSCSTPE